MGDNIKMVGGVRVQMLWVSGEGWWWWCPYMVGVGGIGLAILVSALVLPAMFAITEGRGVVGVAD